MSKTKFEYLFGIHTVTHFFKSDLSHILEMWVLAERHDAKIQNLLTQAQQQGIATHSVPKKTLDKLAQGQNHQGVIIRCKSSTAQNEHDLMTLLDKLEIPPFLLVLDEVQDPHNLGACLRTADAAGVHAVIVPKNNTASLSPTVRKVASGAAETIPLIQVTNLARTLRTLQEQGIWLTGTTDSSQQSIFATNLTGGLALIMGAEGSGLRRLTQEACDNLVYIPMLGQVESLNVSVATGICLYEAVRQRQS